LPRWIAPQLSKLVDKVPTLLRDANWGGGRPPPLSVAKLTAIAPDACRLH
jgi:hypothetical protein